MVAQPLSGWIVNSYQRGFAGAIIPGRSLQPAARLAARCRRQQLHRQHWHDDTRRRQ
jgi:hypothetical protein